MGIRRRRTTTGQISTVDFKQEITATRADGAFGAPLGTPATEARADPHLGDAHDPRVDRHHRVSGLVQRRQPEVPPIAYEFDPRCALPPTRRNRLWARARTTWHQRPPRASRANRPISAWFAGRNDVRSNRSTRPRRTVLTKPVRAQRRAVDADTPAALQKAGKSTSGGGADFCNASSASRTGRMAVSSSRRTTSPTAARMAAPMRSGESSDAPALTATSPRQWPPCSRRGTLDPPSSLLARRSSRAPPPLGGRAADAHPCPRHRGHAPPPFSDI